MAAGLVERYQMAGVTPPIVLNVDCGCCKEVGETKLKIHFSEWLDLIVRLDIWHLMLPLVVYHRRPSTDSTWLLWHTSACSFEWDADDLAMLRRTKREQLKQQNWHALGAREQQVEWCAQCFFDSERMQHMWHAFRTHEVYHITQRLEASPREECYWKLTNVPGVSHCWNHFTAIWIDSFQVYVPYPWCVWFNMPVFMMFFVKCVCPHNVYFL